MSFTSERAPVQGARDPWVKWSGDPSGGWHRSPLEGSWRLSTVKVLRSCANPCKLNKIGCLE
jgi:hypothetical protein